MTRASKLLLMFMLCLWLLSPVAFGKDASWVEKRKASKELLTQGKYVEAEALYRETRTGAANARAKESILAECDYGIAVCLDRQGKPREANPYWRSALTIFTKSNGLESKNVAHTLVGLGNNCDMQGNYAEAEPLLRQAVEVNAKVFANDPLSQVSAIANLSKVLRDRGEYKEAQTLAEKAVALARQYTTPTNKTRLTLPLSVLALVLEKQSQYEKATPLHEEALKISEQASGNTSTLVGNLASNYVLRGRLSEAGPLYQRQIDIEQKLYGDNNPNLALPYNNLGMLYLFLGKYKEAEEALKAAISISESAIGRSAPKTCLYIANLGRIHLETGQVDEAIKESSESVRLTEQSMGTDSVDLIWPLYYLGYASYLKKDYKGAIAFYERSIAIAQEKWATSHRNLSKLKSALALVKAKETAKANPNVDWTQALGRTNSSNVPNTPIRDRWALVVGVSKYGSIKGANNFAQNGAEMFATYLIKHAGFKEDHVYYLSDEKATRENIMAAMGDHFLPRNARPDDLVVIYMATHGSPSESDVGHLNYLVAYNTRMEEPYATAIPLQYISRTVSERIAAKRVVIVLESCHSGAATRRTAGVDAADLAQGTGQIVLTSSRPDQESIAWQNLSPIFTYSLIQGLISKGKETTLEEAFAYAKTKVPQYVAKFGKTQTPMMVCGWPGENLKLAKP